MVGEGRRRCNGSWPRARGGRGAPERANEEGGLTVGEGGGRGAPGRAEEEGGLAVGEASDRSRRGHSRRACTGWAASRVDDDGRGGWMMTGVDEDEGVEGHSGRAATRVDDDDRGGRAEAGL